MSVRDVVNKLRIFMQFSAFMQLQEWIARSNSFIFATICSVVIW